MNDDLLAAIEGMGDGVIVIDEGGKVLVRNEKARQLLGVESGERAEGDLPRSYTVCTLDGRRVEQRDFPISRALRGEACDQAEYLVRTHSGEERYISITARPIGLSDHRRGAVGVLRDITRSKELEKRARMNETLYRAIACNLPNGGVFLFDTNLNILAAYGPTFLSEANLRQEDLVGKNVSVAARPANRAAVVELYRATISGEELSLETTRGGRVYETHTVPVRDESGAIVAGLALSYDITRHREDAQQTRALSAKMSTLMEHLSAGVLFEDVAGRVQFVNRTFCEMFGYGDGAGIVGRPRSDAAREPPVRDLHAFGSVLQQRIDGKTPVSADRIFLIDGRIIERDYVPVDVAGIAEGHFWCFRDVTQRERARVRAAEISNRDELTGLYNRRGFLTLAEQWLRLAARTRRTPLVLFIDVNGMKPVNDAYGHAVGDQLLRASADALRASYRDSDILARLGGDEFVVLAVDAAPEHIPLLIHRLQTKVDAFNAAEQRPYRLSLSVGTAIWDPAQPKSIEKLLEEADAKMYEAKRLVHASAPARVGSTC